MPVYVVRKTITTTTIYNVTADDRNQAEQKAASDPPADGVQIATGPTVTQIVRVGNQQ